MPGLKNILKRFIKKVPVLRELAYFIVHLISKPFPGSEQYWEERYAKGGDSGVGSSNKFARFKADILNTFVQENKIKTVIEYGCGDGNQLKLAQYPHYIGFDVSPSAITSCKETFKWNKKWMFKLMNEYNSERAELTLSLDIIYHLVEDQIFHSHMERLFFSSDRYVIIYSSNREKKIMAHPAHIKHREFTKWIDRHLTGWKLIKHIPNKYPFDGNEENGSFSDFFIYEKML
jgi:hypothetical protein